MKLLQVTSASGLSAVILINEKQKTKKEFAKNKFGPKFDFGFFVFSFFNAESKNRFSVFGLNEKGKGGTVSVFSFFVLTEKLIILWYPDPKYSVEPKCICL